MLVYLLLLILLTNKKSDPFSALTGACFLYVL
jgi:hypothetical protein